MTCCQPVLSGVIAAIGEPDFAATVADLLCRFAGFELAAVIVHRPRSHARILHETFGAIGHRDAVDTYARDTHRFNPMLAGLGNRAVRACDYRRSLSDIPVSSQANLLAAPREELGFRTVGWPERLEEIGLYVPGWEGMIELSLYRERGRQRAHPRLLGALSDLAAPVGAAFERHRLLGPVRQPASGASWMARTSSLSAREDQICGLLLAGYSSDAIALKLSLSRHTVKDHRKNIFRKLGVTSLAELFALAR